MKPLAEVPEDRVRFGQVEVVFHQHRDLAVRVEAQELGLARLTFGEIDGHEFVRRPDLGEGKTNLQGVERLRIDGAEEPEHGARSSTAIAAQPVVPAGRVVG